MSIKFKQISTSNMLYSKCVRLRYEHFWKPYRLLTSANFESEEASSVIFVACKSTNVVGCVLLSYEPNCAWYRLRQLVVDPRVQKQGIGTQLLSCAEGYLCENKQEHVVLYAHEDCYSFFEKRGFKPLTGWYSHQNGMHSILMEHRFSKEKNEK